MSAPRKLFVTTALPYANGKFHIGHIMEYIQADVEFAVGVGQGGGDEELARSGHGGFSRGSRAFYRGGQ